MASREGQSTDAINAAALTGATSAGEGAKTVMSKSAQEIARERTNQNTQTGSGGTNPGANVQAGK